jgi:hypothetical protein
MNAKLLLSLTCSCLHFKAAVGHEVFNESAKLSLGLVRDLTLSADSGWNVWDFASDSVQVHNLELGDLRGLELVQISTHSSEKHDGLLLDSHWHVLFLLEELSELLSSVEELLSGGIKI